MKTIEKTDPNRYYIVTGGSDDIATFGKLMDEQVLATGQPNLFSFLTEEEMVSKLNELTGSDEYYLNSDYYKENHQ